MRNLTISVRDEVLHSTRVAAAHAGKSMSQYVSDLLEQTHQQQTTPADAETKRRLDRLRTLFDGPRWNVTNNGRMPTADERNAR